MGKTAVTQAIYNYLTPSTSQLPALGTVYTALPKVANEQDLFENSYPGQGVGGVIYMFFTKESSQRKALGGAHDGRKVRVYDLGLLVVFKSDIASGSPTQSPTEMGQQAFDEFIDNLVAYIEADRNAGDPSVIFQWGEGTMVGGQDITIDYTVPRTIAGGVGLYQAVFHIDVLEIVDT